MSLFKDKYQHLFFDLDHTLWDFETNAAQTLKETYVAFKLGDMGVTSHEEFIAVYKAINDQMWTLYREEKITKDQLRITRYQKALAHFNIIDVQLADEIGHYYIDNCPLKTAVMPGTFELLDYLKEHYQLHIITNGFEEIQPIKMKGSGLDKYFPISITSETAGAKKPNAQIFDYALEQTGAKVDNSLMIGDTLEADVLGARNYGMDQVYFNPNEQLHTDEVTFEIKHLLELKEIL